MKIYIEQANGLVDGCRNGFWSSATEERAINIEFRHTPLCHISRLWKAGICFRYPVGYDDGRGIALIKPWTNYDSMNVGNVLECLDWHNQTARRRYKLFLNFPEYQSLGN